MIKVGFSELNSIVPTFPHYILLTVSIGIPFLILIGYVHFKKSSAFLSETSVNIEVNPYHRRTLVNSEVILRLNYEMLELMTNLNKLSEDEKERIEKLKKEIEKFVPKRKFSDNSDIEYLKRMYDSKK